MTSMILSKNMFKSLASGATSAIIDKFYYQSTNMKSTLIMASIVTISSYASSFISPKFSISSYENEMIDADVIQMRILELMSSIGGSYLINKYFDRLKSNFDLKDTFILFFGSAIVGEYASDYMYKNELSYLS